MNQQQLADKLGVAVSKVRFLVRQGALQPERHAGRQGSPMQFSAAEVAHAKRLLSVAPSFKINVARIVSDELRKEGEDG